MIWRAAIAAFHSARWTDALRAENWSTRHYACENYK